MAVEIISRTAHVRALVDGLADVPSKFVVGPPEHLRERLSDSGRGVRDPTIGGNVARPVSDSATEQVIARCLHGYASPRIVRASSNGFSPHRPVESRTAGISPAVASCRTRSPQTPRTRPAALLVRGGWHWAMV